MHCWISEFRTMRNTHLEIKTEKEINAFFFILRRAKITILAKSSVNVAKRIKFNSRLIVVPEALDSLEISLDLVDELIRFVFDFEVWSRVRQLDILQTYYAITSQELGKHSQRKFRTQSKLQCLPIGPKVWQLEFVLDKALYALYIGYDVSKNLKNRRSKSFFREFLPTVSIRILLRF